MKAELKSNYLDKDSVSFYKYKKIHNFIESNIIYYTKNNKRL